MMRRLACVAAAAVLALPAAAQQQTAATSGGVEAGTQPQARFVRTDDARADPGQGSLPSVMLAPASQDGAARQSEVDRRFHRAPERPKARLNLGSARAVPIDAPPTELRGGARLRELDKMTGRAVTFDMAVGDEREVGRLKIEVDGCRSPEGNDMHGTMAFLKIWDTRAPDEELFSGWMFAESPSLSALDHPRYDLWVISCTTSGLATSSGSE